MFGLPLVYDDEFVKITSHYIPLADPKSEGNALRWLNCDGFWDFAEIRDCSHLFAGPR